MPTAMTEARSPMSVGIDKFDDLRIMDILLNGQIDAATSINQSINSLCEGARAMAKAVSEGHQLVYAAAGSSGLQAIADGLEITPTFGVPLQQIQILRAGGMEGLSRLNGAVEDDAEAAADDAGIIAAGDCVICLAASGNTVYPVTIMNVANDRGATTIGISNNPETELLKHSDIPILLPTPPEVIAGSTRLGAGTAQKIALNMMSTLMGIQLGHVMDGLMVNVIANNNKLLDRAQRIVSDLTGCQLDVAAEKLEITDGSVKEAVLMVEGVGSLEEARRLLERADGNLRRALDRRADGRTETHDRKKQSRTRKE